jgi:hypothetical protein
MSQAGEAAETIMPTQNGQVPWVNMSQIFKAKKYVLAILV